MGKSGDERFVNRVFTRTEKNIISSSPNPDGILWTLWAAKEAAYKSAVKSCRNISSTPVLYEVDFHADGREGLLTGRVKTPAGIVNVSLFPGSGYVHCLGGVFSHGDLDSVLWTVGEMDIDRAKEPGYESSFVRKLAVDYLSSIIGVDASSIDIVSCGESSIPRLHINGRCNGIDVSLSHDGRFAAAAFLMYNRLKISSHRI